MFKSGRYGLYQRKMGGIFPRYENNLKTSNITKGTKRRFEFFKAHGTMEADEAMKEPTCRCWAGDVGGPEKTEGAKGLKGPTIE